MGDTSGASDETVEPVLAEKNRLPRRLFLVIAVVIMLVSVVMIRIFLPYAREGSRELLEEGIKLEEVATGLGSPSCLHWHDSDWLLVCDRDGRILALEMNDNGNLSDPVELLTGLDRPHGALTWVDTYNGSQRLFVSETGKLTAWDLENGTDPGSWSLGTGDVLVSGIPSENHQTNSVMPGINGSLLWHSGSTCNICDEDDVRNAALLEVNPWTGGHSVVASGVRNSYDGAWMEGVGYLFTDNGRDWDGDDYPYEELNLLMLDAAYGWPDASPDDPSPTGTLGPVATFTPHSSINGIDVRPDSSSLPGGNRTVYVTVFGSWNALIPTGEQLIRIDLVEDSNSPQGWRGEVTVVIEDLPTVLPLRFHPDGDLYFCQYSQGNLFRLSST
ncbi:MAG: hypothetical protein QF566_01545 [Candidatus Thalassarchaeaceae archaeon]|jgi:glucose/arabinose dehydrogenase|nr:hypothetical protein [Candidatus Thalassarchaeaceae archaeon]